LHQWKIISFYNFSKYDLFSTNNGMDYVQLMERISRKELYAKKRDRTFDFMAIGEDEFDTYKFRLP